MEEEIIETTEVPEETETPETPEITPEQAEAVLKAAGKWPEPQAPPPVYRQERAEFVEGTRVPKPDGYDDWEWEKRAAYISEFNTSVMMTQLATANNNTRILMGKAQDWFKEEMDEVLSELPPDQIGQPLTDNNTKWLVQQAKGRAVDKGKFPSQKQTPTGAPANNQPPKTSSQTTVVANDLLKGVADAGYEVLANDPAFKEILSR